MNEKLKTFAKCVVLVLKKMFFLSLGKSAGTAAKLVKNYFVRHCLPVGRTR